jgi:hypothetical protein
MKYIKKRIELEEHEYKNLLEILEEYEYKYLHGKLYKKIENAKDINQINKKSDATIKATKAREEAAKKKILKAIKELELTKKRGHIKKITYKLINEKSGCHVNTIKKYYKI